jgi:nondiscriminating aspartyl-tRNA synthetase
MSRVWSADLSSHVGERVRIAGWYHHYRQLRSVSFLLLRDATGVTQVVVEDPALVERLAGLPHESVLSLEGRVLAEPQAPGGVEMREPRIEVLSPAVEEPPLELYRPHLRAQLPTILDHAPLGSVFNGRA